MVAQKLNYVKVGKGSHKQFVHIKVWEQFHGQRRPGYQIHHIDGNPKNNSIQNLVELKTEYHLTYHKLSKILNKTIKQMNVFIGMQPSDTTKFYNKIRELADRYHVAIDGSGFSKRRTNGTGLDKIESIKHRMIETGKKHVMNGEPAYWRGNASSSELCKKNAVKYFGSLENYVKLCS